MKIKSASALVQKLLIWRRDLVIRGLQHALYILMYIGDYVPRTIALFEFRLIWKHDRIKKRIFVFL